MPPLCIAHRGARSLAPENTLLAARKAHALGCELWETDVAFTKDGELILFHDDSLARTTDAERRFPKHASDPFWEWTLADIQTLSPGARFLETDPFGQLAAGAIPQAERSAIRAERVPTLLAALELTRALGWRVNLELKRLPPERKDFPLLDRVLAAVDEAKAGPAHVLFSSGEHFWLDELARRRPEFDRQALVGLFAQEPLDYSSDRFDTYNVRGSRVPPEDVKRLAARGKTINVYTVNEEADMLRFAAAGAAGLITDFPQRQRALLRAGRL